MRLGAVRLPQSQETIPDMYACSVPWLDKTLGDECAECNKGSGLGELAMALECLPMLY